MIAYERLIIDKLDTELTLASVAAEAFTFPPEVYRRMQQRLHVFRSLKGVRHGPHRQARPQEGW